MTAQPWITGPWVAEHWIDDDRREHTLFPRDERARHLPLLGPTARPCCVITGEDAADVLRRYDQHLKELLARKTHDPT